MAHINLLPNEQVLLELRRHPLVVFLELLLFAFLMSIPVIIYALVYIAGIALSENVVLFAFVILGTSIYYLYIWIESYVHLQIVSFITIPTSSYYFFYCFHSLSDLIASTLTLVIIPKKFSSLVNGVTHTTL